VLPLYLLLHIPEASTRQKYTKWVIAGMAPAATLLLIIIIIMLQGPLQTQ
jgi:hypothetical protein